MGAFKAFGLRRLMDSYQNYYATGQPIYYRTLNFVPKSSVALEMGLSVPAVSGSGGTTDKLICPQPGVSNLSLHQIATANEAGVHLRTGAVALTVSHTWVATIQQQKGYTFPKQVFTDKSVVGLYSGGLLYSIEDYGKENDIYGAAFVWRLLVNANEIK